MIKKICKRYNIQLILLMVILFSLLNCGDRGTTIKETFWSSGQIKERYEVSTFEGTEEIKHGTYLSWYESSNFHVEGYFIKDRKDGIWTYLYDTEDSIKLMQGKFVDGEMHGRWRYWMNPNHQHGGSGSKEHHHKDTPTVVNRVHPKPHKLENYKMGVRHGLSISWHHTGHVADSITYRNGKLHGTIVSYHKNGTIASEAHYSDGTLEGTRNFWDSLGQR